MTTVKRPSGLGDSPVIEEVKARTALWKAITALVVKATELLEEEANRGRR